MNLRDSVLRIAILVLMAHSAGAEIHYQGLAGGYGIVLTLDDPIRQARDDSPANISVTGVYYYREHEIPIRFEGLWLPDGTLFLREGEGNDAAVFSFKMYDTEKPSIKGVWTNSRIEYDVNLERFAGGPDRDRFNPIYGGFLDGEEVRLTLNFDRTDDEVRGTFLYVESQKRIALAGTWIDGSLQLGASDSDDGEAIFLNIADYGRESSEFWSRVTGAPSGELKLTRTEITPFTQGVNGHRFRLLEFGFVKNLEVFEGGRLVQRIDLSHCIAEPPGRYDRLAAGDYNFDGIPDLMFFCDQNIRSTSSRLLIFDAESNAYYDSAYVDSETVFDGENKVLIMTDFFHDTKTETYYRWNQYVLVEVDMKRYVLRRAEWVAEDHRSARGSLR